VTACTAVLVIAADQVTKSLAEAHLRGPVHLWGPFGFALTYNTGSSFSLFSGRTLPLVIIDVVLVVAIGAFAWRSRGRFMALAIGLVLGGALGNLSDRAFRGHHGAVVDFVTLTHWPTFNVADACITTGVILGALLSFRAPTTPAP
jgi:signal peptidase II